MRLVLLSTAVTLLAVAPAAAHEPDLQSRYSAAYNACLDAANGTYEMLQCANEERDIQDRALNETYNRVMADLNARQRAKLRAAQRAWIAYRDARCQSFADEDWGTLSSVTARMCVVEMTVQRLVDLEAYPPN